MGIDTLQDLRDVTIISFAIAGTVLFVIASLSVATLRKVKSVVGDNVQPTLENVRETTENVRGTVAFISDYAVTPVVRRYGIFAGARRCDRPPGGGRRRCAPATSGRCRSGGSSGPSGQPLKSTPGLC